MAQLKQALSYTQEVLKQYESSYIKLVDRFIQLIFEDEIESSDIYPTFTIQYQNILLDNKPCFQLTYSIQWVEHEDVENNEQDLSTFSTSLNLILYFKSKFSHTPSEIIRVQKTNSSLDEITKKTIADVRVGLRSIGREDLDSFVGYDVTLTH